LAVIAANTAPGFRTLVTNKKQDGSGVIKNFKSAHKSGWLQNRISEGGEEG